jgi:sugar lactone lactonase YvrE
MQTFPILESTFRSDIHHNTRWKQDGVIVAGGNGEGNGLNQLNRPVGVYVNDDQTIYVADCANHRIVKWKCSATNGQVVAGGNGQGDKTNQFNYPRDIIVDREGGNLLICDRDNRRVMRWSHGNDRSGQIIIPNIDCNRLRIDDNGYLYISDYKKHEVRRWKIGDKNGTLVAGGNGQGNGLNQLHGPNSIFVDEYHSVYVSDCNNHRVMKWMEGATEGIVVAGGQGKGSSLRQLSGPTGVIVDRLGTVYIGDCDNHRIMRWRKGATQGEIVVGKNGKGEQAKQLNSPGGLSFDQYGNLYVVDFFNHRVQRFDIDRSS